MYEKLELVFVAVGELPMLCGCICNTNTFFSPLQDAPKKTPKVNSGGLQKHKQTDRHTSRISTKPKGTLQFIFCS